MHPHNLYQYFKQWIHYYNQIVANFTSPCMTEFAKMFIVHTIINI